MSRGLRPYLRARKAHEAGCWSHTRKYFLDALRVAPILVREPFELIQTLFCDRAGGQAGAA